MNRRVLVTGSEGFTGRYVINALADAGWEVWGSGTGAIGSTPRYVRLDLLVPSSIKSALEVAQPHLVIHLAAVSFAAEEDSSRYYYVNVIGAHNLLSALASMRRSPDRVILASSANVYGNPDQCGIKETCKTKPQSDYAVSKLSMESVSRLFKGTFSINIVRPFNYTGIGQSARFLVPKIVAHVRRRSPSIELGNLEVERDFSDVRDIARYYVSLAEKGCDREIINFCSGQLISLRSILQIATEKTGHKMAVHVNPALTRKNEVFRLSGDRSNLDAIAGRHINFNIASTIEWMLG